MIPSGGITALSPAISMKRSLIPKGLGKLRVKQQYFDKILIMAIVRWLQPVISFHRAIAFAHDAN